MQKGEGEIPLGYRTPDSTLKKISSWLRFIGGIDEWQFKIYAKEWIYVCSKCGWLVIQSDQFMGHGPLIEGRPSCTEPKFIQYRPGSTLHTHVVVFWHPKALLDCFSTLLLRLASGDESSIPLYTEPWLHQLEAVYHEQTRDVKDWLTGLIEVAQEIWRVREKGYAGDGNLVKLGRKVDSYRAGLDILYRWLFSETE